jgi:hypothetical protein
MIMAWPPDASRALNYTVTPDNWNELAKVAPCRLGVTATVTPTGSPWTLTNTDDSYWLVYFFGGAVNSFTKNSTDMGANLPMFILLGPGQAVVVDYDVAPTVVVDK